ncbi:MAG: RNA polymerase sigma factor [Planctomycetota bacterium]
MDRDNATWLAELRGGGHAQEAALADLRTRLVAGLSHSLRGRADGATFFEDVAQDALVRILDKLDTFRGDSRFTSWAMTIAVRTGITELRRRKWGEVSLDQMASDEDVARPFDPEDADAGPDAKTQRKAILAELDKAIRQHLTEKQRQTLLAELGGMPQAEIARRMGSNRNAIYKMMHDARKRLRSSLEAGGYSSNEIRVAFDF